MYRMSSAPDISGADGDAILPLTNGVATREDRRPAPASYPASAMRTWGPSSSNSWALAAEDSTLSQGTLLALESSSLRIERQRLRRAQEKHQKWLKKALSEQVNMYTKEFELLRAQDLEDKKRTSMVERSRQDTERTVQSKKEQRELREYQCFENNRALERRRKADIAERDRLKQMREERFSQERALQREEDEEHAMREAARKRAVLERHDQTLEDKRSLNEAKVRVKEERAETLVSEKQRLWRLRKMMVDEGQFAWESLKGEIQHQRVHSTCQMSTLQHQVDDSLNSELFSPRLTAE